ncbi:MAG: VOC family protein [Bdellovibrionaceae bacterium]|nr:VOC family protein [Pseudobdellovibrionaceae bacterium]
MISGYVDFYYNVQDMKRAVTFYKEALQMEVSHTHEFWTEMRVGNLRLGLHWTEGSSVPKTPRNDHGQECGGTLTLHSTDVRGDRDRIHKSGGKILGEAEQPWGHMLVFEDPDGNVLKLMKPANA